MPTWPSCIPTTASQPLPQGKLQLPRGMQTPRRSPSLSNLLFTWPCCIPASASVCAKASCDCKAAIPCCCCCTIPFTSHWLKGRVALEGPSFVWLSTWPSGVSTRLARLQQQRRDGFHRCVCVCACEHTFQYLEQALYMLLCSF